MGVVDAMREKIGTHIKGGVAFLINWDKISGHKEYHL